MGKTVAVSFEGNSVKIVRASLKGTTLSVNKTEVISNDEFDYYLQKEKASEFIVTCEFRETFHDVLTVPVVKPGYLQKIVQSEIRKITKKKDFSFIYTILGERVIDNKKVLEVFYFAVNNDEIRNAVDRFYNNGKMVRALYPSVFSSASLINPSASGEANMGVLGTERKRIIFFAKGNSIYFIRSYESIDEEFGNFDIQNINMTINYCFQNLRMNPSSVLLMGCLTGADDVSSLPTAPLASLHKTDNIQCSVEQFNDFLLPVASFATPKSSNILSKEFRNIYIQRKYMAYASMVFIILTLLCLGFIWHEIKDISYKKESISLARDNMTDIDRISSEYIEREGKVRQYKPAVDFLNRSNPDIQKLMIALAGIDDKNLKFDYLEARAKDGNTFFVSIDGRSFVSTFSSLQTLLGYLVDTLNAAEGVKVINRKMDLKEKTFRIEMEYRKTG